LVELLAVSAGLSIDKERVQARRFLRKFGHLAELFFGFNGERGKSLSFTGNVFRFLF
jgi:hypothetical protein